MSNSHQGGSEGGGESHGLRVCAVLTCFNRRSKTMECLRALAASVGVEDVALSAILVDDASTDGTAEAVAAAFPWVRVVHGDGSLFWCRGMHHAFAQALSEDHDYFLWLNDDTTLLPDALARLLACAAQLRQTHGQPAIVVGTTVDAVSGEITYGGEARVSPLRPTRFRRVLPGAQPQRCDSMNGNVVLIAQDAARIVGNLDPVFEHAMGDTDYALRAGKLGVAVWVGPGVHGQCSGNPPHGTFMDAKLPLAQRWRQMQSRKGLPWRSWLVLTRRHAGPLWPVYFAWPYVSLVTGGYGRRTGGGS